MDVSKGTGGDYVYIEYTTEPVTVNDEGNIVVGRGKEIDFHFVIPELKPVEYIYDSDGVKIGYYGSDGIPMYYSDPGFVIGDPIGYIDSDGVMVYYSKPTASSFFSETFPYSWIILSVFSAACGGAFVYGIMIKRKKKEGEKVNSKQ